MSEATSAQSARFAQPVSPKPAAQDLYPGLGDVWFSGGVLLDGSADFLSDEAFRVLMRLVRFVAASRVWTYTAPGDGLLPADERRLAKLCGVSFRQWRRVRADVAQFFDVTSAGWRLQSDWIRIGKSPDSRLPITPAVREEIVRRDRRACRYCGTAQGPFDIDHIVPVSRGGSNDPQNLVLACQPCNRSKGAKLLREWRP